MGCDFEAVRDARTILLITYKRDGTPAGTPVSLRAPALLDEFFTAAAIEQAQQSAGNLGADALADADNAWWSVSAWQGRGPMQAFVDSEQHRSISTRLDHFCDEATFVDWEQPSPDLPDWQTSWRHITADGKVAELTQSVRGKSDPCFPRAGRGRGHRQLTGQPRKQAPAT